MNVSDHYYPGKFHHLSNLYENLIVYIGIETYKGEIPNHVGIYFDIEVFHPRVGNSNGLISKKRFLI